MREKSILIIGAGVAGLCAGIYGQMNGYRTKIVEKHRIPGGLVTAWRREGYLIDLCIHWLTGSGPGIFLHRYWNEVGLLDGREFIPHDRYGVYHASDGRAVHFFCDPDRLERHLLELAPEDSEPIHDLVEGMRLGIRFNPPMKERYESGLVEWVRFIVGMMPLGRGIQQWSRISIRELAGRFSSPILREALLNLFDPDSSVFYMILSQAGFMVKEQASYPLGGSLPLALALEKRYRQLGGQVQYRTRVQNILVEGGQAVGLRYDDGSEERADVVIAAGDGYTTIFELLKGRFADRKVQEMYETWKPFHSMIYASAGVKRTFPEFPYSLEGDAFELKNPVMIAGEEHSVLPVRIRNEDPNFAPEGKTVMTSAIYSSRDFWSAFEHDPARYEVEKTRVARAYLDALEQVWPGISADVEMVNVATPLTFERITGNLNGSITGWTLTPDQAGKKISQTLPGLDNFWMVGQWVYAGGGLPAGVSTAREVIWKQCKKDRKQFNGSLKEGVVSRRPLRVKNQLPNVGTAVVSVPEQ
jgi:phytoene dehydrogenase-like protein